jgi:uncharacterized protein YjiS (DUF1127 family)
MSLQDYHRHRDGLTSRLASAAHNISRRLEAYRRKRRERARVVAELSISSDRELAELGYSREDLIAIARGTYQR